MQACFQTMLARFFGILDVNSDFQVGYHVTYFWFWTLTTGVISMS